MRHTMGDASVAQGRQAHPGEARLVDSSVAAVALGVTVRTVQRWIRDGVLVNYGSTRRVLVSLDSIMDVV